MEAHTEVNSWANVAQIEQKLILVYLMHMWTNAFTIGGKPVQSSI